MTQRGKLLCSAKTEGWGTWLPVSRVPRSYSKSRTLLNTSNLWKTENPRTHRNLCGSSSYMTHSQTPPSRSHLTYFPAFASFITPGDLKLHDATASCQKIQQTYGPVVKPLLGHTATLIQVDIRANTQRKKAAKPMVA